MEDLLRKYKLIDNFTVELPIHKGEFVRRFCGSVDPGGIGLFSGAFEAWESSNNDYKGEVSNQGFKVRRRRKFFQAHGQLRAVATGTFTEARDKLTIRTEVRSIFKKMVPLYLIAAFFYLVAIVTLISTGFSDGANGLPAFVLVFILAHAGLLYFMFFYVMRRGVAELKRDLEREFVYLASRD
jgi:polyferredoxin